MSPVRRVLGVTVNPARPGVVQVSRPSDALAAQRIAESGRNALFPGPGGVAQLVGGIRAAHSDDGPRVGLARRKIGLVNATIVSTVVWVGTGLRTSARTHLLYRLCVVQVAVPPSAET